MENNTEKIDRYLNNEMREEERTSFEQSIKLNPAIDEEVQLQKKMYDFLDNYNQKQRHINQIKSLNQKYFPQKEEIVNKIIPFYKKTWFYGIAASLLLIITVPIIYYNFYNKSVTLNLYTQYAEHETLSFTVLGDGTETTLQKATQFYNEKNYKAALPLLEELPKERSPNIILATGISYLELNQLDKAENTLLTLFDYPIYINEANWYLALTNLKRKNSSTAITYLQKIEDEKSSRYKQAQSLIGELEMR